ncbi:MAG: hypothetical protein C7N36_11480 [Bacteroidetes bacterium]|nr:MAG: hypothetical protein C7N36_11480 [Bacteroidota bacterium]
MLAAATFQLLGSSHYANFPVFLCALATWQLILGCRNILLHQINDRHNDTRSNTHSLVRRYSEPRLEQVMTYLFLPLETIAFLVFLTVLAGQIPWLIPAYLVFVLYVYWRNKWLLQTSHTPDYRQVFYWYLDDFYLDWLPVLIALALGLPDFSLLIILGIHLLLFRHGLRQLWSDGQTLLQRVWHLF